METGSLKTVSKTVLLLIWKIISNDITTEESESEIEALLKCPDEKDDLTAGGNLICSTGKAETNILIANVQLDCFLSDLRKHFKEIIENNPLYAISLMTAINDNFCHNFTFSILSLPLSLLDTDEKEKIIKYLTDVIISHNTEMNL